MARKTRPTRPLNYRDKTPSEILEIYPENFMECREGHDWSRRAIWTQITPYLRERTIQCKRCSSTKSMHVNDVGRVVRKPYMSYVRGYQTPRSGLTRSDFTSVSFVRDFNKALTEGRVRGNVSTLHSA